jgi:hypothetical protein
VVADEVRKLAERSASSTKEIEGLIKESGKSVTSGVEIAQAALQAMQGIIAGAEKSNQMVGALAADIEQQIGSIREVAKATESISEMSQSISAATEEQTTNAKQVAKAIENVNELTQQAASAAEQMSGATEELSGLAQSLQKLVEQFRLAGTPAWGRRRPVGRRGEAESGRSRCFGARDGHRNRAEEGCQGRCRNPATGLSDHSSADWAPVGLTREGMEKKMGERLVSFGTGELRPGILRRCRSKAGDTRRFDNRHRPRLRQQGSLAQRDLLDEQHRSRPRTKRVTASWSRWPTRSCCASMRKGPSPT